MSEKIIVKYQVNKGFKDKYTKEEIKADKVIDISIKRMKELNEHNVGKVIDILVERDVEETLKEDDPKKEETKNEYTQEELEKMTVNELKDLAEGMKIELTKAKKEEIIQEILEN